MNPKSTKKKTRKSRTRPSSVSILDIIMMEPVINKDGEAIYASRDEAIIKLLEPIAAEVETKVWSATKNITNALSKELNTFGPTRLVFWASSAMGLLLMATIVAVENAAPRKV